MAALAADADADAAAVETKLPRVVIQYCTQCKWLLRAAYYAQELLSTFSTTLGEVALQPATGGTFVVSLVSKAEEDDSSAVSGGAGGSRRLLLWDRARDGGFPETKELKRRVRDAVAPGRDLGHVDRVGGSSNSSSSKKQEEGKVVAAPAGVTAATVTIATATATAPAAVPPPALAVPPEAPKTDEKNDGPATEVCEDCQ
ncbi:selenoprotein domain protein [Niveomyces insectorum RCEF 264]|uniref:Selenoprotein domain protein n=1 Tax=Niveomyces insectorum RCEF 264 TaxID=1081102 RepID=A0A167RA77_9HYPO|nr:selenoprotein domain protein [Niveomyces insectorum RCEF 264]